MPYYRWKGVNILGDMRMGKSFARSVHDLDKTLFSRNIALIASDEKKVGAFFNKISPDDKISFFRQLAVLLDSGVRLPDALGILCDQVRNVKLKQIIFEIESDVCQGFSFGKSLAKHPNIFDTATVQIVAVGQESGDLSNCLKQLSEYLEEKQAFYKKLKSASLLPLITLAFFFVVMFSIFTFVVPKFADVFRSMGKELPPLTQTILKISEFLRSNNFVFFMIFFGVCIFLIRKYLATPSIKKLSDKISLNMPFIGSVYRQSFLVYFLRSVSMLLKGGTRLVPAIGISKNSIKNDLLKSHVCNLENDVYAGSSLSQSMTDYGGKLFPQDLVAIVKVGEETAKMHVMLDKAADIYQQKINRSILFFTTVFQPLLMIVLGLLITLLIFAIYVPVFSLASIV
ncbi:type II secretion system F family protein [Candidatus Dependentiae bacterium]